MLDNFYSQMLDSRQHHNDLLRMAERDRLAVRALDSGARPARRLRLRPLVQAVFAAVSQRETRRVPALANAGCASGDC